MILTSGKASFFDSNLHFSLLVLAILLGLGGLLKCQGFFSCSISRCINCLTRMVRIHMQVKMGVWIIVFLRLHLSYVTKNIFMDSYIRHTILNLLPTTPFLTLQKVFDCKKLNKWFCELFENNSQILLLILVYLAFSCTLVSHHSKEPNEDSIIQVSLNQRKCTTKSMKL